MAIKTDAMIAHNGADGYTLHVDYDPDTDAYDLKAMFNDGTVKEINGSVEDGSKFSQMINRTIKSVESDVRTVGYQAFNGCSALKYANMPNAKYIKSSSFSTCTALEVVLLPSAVTISNSSFYKTQALRYAYIGPNANSIGESTFTDSNASLVIDCGFSSDAAVAAGAPWGAPVGVTINYDVPAPNPPAVSALSMAPAPDLIQNIDLEQVEEIQPIEEPEVKKTMKRRSK